MLSQATACRQKSCQWQWDPYPLDGPQRCAARTGVAGHLIIGWPQKWHTAVFCLRGSATPLAADSRASLSTAVACTSCLHISAAAGTAAARIAESATCHQRLKPRLHEPVLQGMEGQRSEAAAGRQQHGRGGQQALQGKRQRSRRRTVSVNNMLPTDGCVCGKPSANAPPLPPARC